MRLIDADSLITELSKLFPSKMPFDYNEDDNDLGAILCDIKDIIDVQPTVNQWILCSKRLPEESNYYMACIYNSAFDEYDFRKTWFAHADDYDISESEWRELYESEKVTAWMPLPKLYKEEQHGK